MTFARIRGAGFAANTKLASTEMTALDIDHANSLDKTGDTISGTVAMASGAILNFLGGSQIATTPTTTCTIQLGGASSLSSQVAGAIYSTVAGGISGNVAGGITSGVAGGINLTGGAADWVTFPARTRIIAHPCGLVNGVSITTPTTNRAMTLGTSSGNFSPTFQTAYMTESGTMIVWGAPSSTAVGFGFMVPLLGVHNGATMTSATLSVIAAGAHSALPQTQPAFGIFRVTKDTSFTVVPLTVAGYAQAAVGVLAAYTAGFQITFTPTQNNVMDPSLYMYYAIIYDEAGTNALAGNRYVSIAATYSYADSRPA